MSSERLKNYIVRSRKISRGITILLQILFILILDCSGINEGYALNCPVYTTGESAGHRVALTFDDGPHPTKTPEILSILKEHGIKATFFVVGENASRHESLLQRAIDEGHEIGNHTFRHKYLGGKGRALMEREIDLCDDEIYNHSEYFARLFRPPGGIYDSTLRTVCAERGYSVVLWSIDTRDWTGASADDICSEIFGSVNDGSIVLMHDYVCGESHTAEALRVAIPKLKELGYSFVTVSELIGEH